MTLSVHIGTFNADSTKLINDTQAITGVGFQPELVIILYAGTVQTADGVYAEDYSFGIGAFSSATSRWNVVTSSDDAAASSAASRSNSNVRFARVYPNGTTTSLGELDVTSMDSNGFTVAYDKAFTANTHFKYIALAGSDSDLTNIYLGSKAMPTSTGNYSVTDPGFQPDALIVGCAATNAGSNQANDSIWSFGFATGPSNQGVVSNFIDSSVNTSDTAGYGYLGELVAVSSSVTTINIREALVSMDATGFTMNHLEGASAYYYFYIALKGGQYSVGSLTTRTDGNDIAVTTGFTPKAILFASANRATSTQDTLTAHGNISVGFAASTTSRACAAIWDEDNLADTETCLGIYDTAVYARVQDDAIQALMDLKSMDASGFTCVMDDTEPSAGATVIYLAIGETAAAPGGTAVPVFVHHLRQQGIGG